MALCSAPPGPRATNPPARARPGSPDDLACCAERLQASGRYRVLQRFEPPTHYHAEDGTATARALAVDVETTGLDPAGDAIIQLCAIPFEYCRATGRIFGVGPAAIYFEDPGRPISADVTALTGLTNAAVVGQRIDNEAVLELLRPAALVIAHNAAFDRRCLERRLPAFAAKPWACSQREVPWARYGLAARTLEFLMYRHCSCFYDAHTAATDCAALIHLLATPFPSGERPLQLLLTAARARTARLWALAAPFARKDALKARRYRWSAGNGGRPRAWFLDLPESGVAAECAWLEQHVYGGARGRWRLQVYGARARYSDRL